MFRFANGIANKYLLTILIVISAKLLYYPVADLHAKILDAPPPICLIFMQFSANFGQIMGRRPLSGWHPLGILDLPLLSTQLRYTSVG